MFHSTLPTNNMAWGSSPNYDFLNNHDADIEGVIQPLLLGQGTVPASAPNPATLNASNAQEAQILLQLRMTRLEQRAVGLQQQLLQYCIQRQWTDIVPENAVSNDVPNSVQEPSPPFGQQTSPSGAQHAIVNGPLLPLQYDNTVTMPNPVHGPSVTELPSDLSNSTDPNLMHNSYGSASDDGRIWSDGNCFPPFHPTFPSGELPAIVFTVTETETVADRFPSENQKTQALVPRSEPVTLVPKRRRSVPDRPGFACLSTNEQESNVRREKKGRTKEECENTKEVKELGSCFRCRLGKKRVSFVL